MEASEFQTSEVEEGGGDNSATFHLLLSQIEASKWLDNWYEIDVKHYKLLYEADGRHRVEAVPKLSKEHMDPNNSRKMNIGLAGQVIVLDSSCNASRTTAPGLSMHSRLKHPGLEDCAETKRFAVLGNNLFDAISAEHPMHGVEECSEMATTAEFLESVNVTEQYHRTRRTCMSASQVTMDVVTGKLNQDPVE
ncbi:hypothetical protein ISCGN_015240 [Ixodes scapularis]